MTSVLLQKITFLIVRSTRLHRFPFLRLFCFRGWNQHICGCSFMQLVLETSKAQIIFVCSQGSFCIAYVGFSQMHRLYKAIQTWHPCSIMTWNLAIRKCIIEMLIKKNLLGSITKMSPVLIYCTVVSILTPNAKYIHHILLLALETNYSNCV